MRRHIFAPEVLQISAMDCGPAALKCLLEGHGIPVHYGRLREACQTSIDGTSINTIEDILQQHGFDAKQQMLPPDQLLFPAAEALPALVVTRLSSGATHFVVVWSRYGRLLQVMDPARGRRWLTPGALSKELYVHNMLLPAAKWRAWASSQRSVSFLRMRLVRLGIDARQINSLLEPVLADSDWYPLARLDAAVRMVESIMKSGGCRRGQQTAQVLEILLSGDEPAAPDGVAGAYHSIPENFWTVRPADVPAGKAEIRLVVQGALYLSLHGQRSEAARTAGTGPSEQAQPKYPVEPRHTQYVNADLAAAFRQTDDQPYRTLHGLMGAREKFLAIVLLGLLLPTVGGSVLLALLFQRTLDLSQQLRIPEQRLGAWAMLVGFLIVLLVMEAPIAMATRYLGRHLESRLRIAFLEKIPRLGDRYFQSRLISDMAERCHSIHHLCLLPDMAGQLLLFSAELTLTVVAIAWLDPDNIVPILCVGTLSALLPFVLRQPLIEKDLRVRTHAGALSRFYLDALMALLVIRTHSAERIVRREYEGLLVHWLDARHALLRTVLSIEFMNLALGFGLAIWMFLDYVERAAATSDALLLLFWVLSIPALSQQLTTLLRQYPLLRNLLVRLIEPLGALEVGRVQTHNPGDSQRDAPPHHPHVDDHASVPGHAQAVEILLRNVKVVAGGHTILSSVDLHVRRGEHVAIVGPSGAGKTSLVDLLLGWHRPASGEFLVDGMPLDEDNRIEKLRLQTAWLDPAVQIWNDSLLANLLYGSSPGPTEIGDVLASADLLAVLDKLPDGLQTVLGEGGALLSGGEGQRVRLGRAMCRQRPSLAILDEPFRGLDREQRRWLLERLRTRWREATFLCVTHDVRDIRGFDRVLVLDGGRIVEDGNPEELLARTDSRYRAMFEAEGELMQFLRDDATWKRMRLKEGRLHTFPPGEYE